MTGAIITAVGTVFSGVLVVLVGYFVRRTDRVAKATRANMADQQYTMRLVSVIRDDYWALADWAYHARGRFAELRAKYCPTVDDFEPLPAIPTPYHRELEARHIRGEDKEDADA